MGAIMGKPKNFFKWTIKYSNFWLKYIVTDWSSDVGCQFLVLLSFFRLEDGSLALAVSPLQQWASFVSQEAILPWKQMIPKFLFLKIHLSTQTVSQHQVALRVCQNRSAAFVFMRITMVYLTLRSVCHIMKMVSYQSFWLIHDPCFCLFDISTISSILPHHFFVFRKAGFNYCWLEQKTVTFNFSSMLEVLIRRGVPFSTGDKKDSNLNLERSFQTVTNLQDS